MILVIGDQIVDSYETYKTVRLSSESGLPVVEPAGVWERQGGALAVVNMCRTLGGEVVSVGNSQCGVGPSYKRRTTIDGKPLYRVDSDITDDFSEKVVNCLRRLQDKPDVVCIADYGKGAISRNVIVECLNRGWRVVADPHDTARSHRYRGVYGIVPNRWENASQGYWDQTTSFPRCCLKLDCDGMRVRCLNEVVSFKSEVDEVVDVCGAGDQVLATIAIMLSRGHDWPGACDIANMAAGIKCTKRGATPVTASELASKFPPVNYVFGSACSEVS